MNINIPHHVRMAITIAADIREYEGGRDWYRRSPLMGFSATEVADGRSEARVSLRFEGGDRLIVHLRDEGRSEFRTWEVTGITYWHYADDAARQERAEKDEFQYTAEEYREIKGVLADRRAT